MEMLRIFDARNADLGKNRVINSAGMTTDRLAALVYSSSTEGAAGPIQRFRDYCLKHCVNRKLVLRDLHLGVNAAKELVSILSVNERIAHLDLSKNDLHDEGVGLLMKAIS